MLSVRFPSASRMFSAFGSLERRHVNKTPTNRQPSACAPQTARTKVHSNSEYSLRIERRLRPRSPRFGTTRVLYTQTFDRHKQPRRRAVRTASVLLLALVVLLLSPSLVDAQYDDSITPFGVNFGGTRYANGSYHTYRSTEIDIVQRYRWEHRFDGAGGQDVYNPTNITLARTHYNIIIPDFYWYVDSLPGTTVGYHICNIVLTDSLCSNDTIVIADDAHNLSELLKNNLVCHEIGHSIGFGHGTSGSSCMSGGDNNQLNTIEVGLINGHY